MPAESRALVLGAVLLSSASACARNPEPGGDNPALQQQSADCSDGSSSTPPNDPLPPTRLLRRISLALTGRAPTGSEDQALLSAKDDAAREAVLDKAVDDMLAAPTFYDLMNQFGREWIGMPEIANTEDAPGYLGSSSRNIAPCPAGTPYQGAYAIFDPFIAGDPPCSGQEQDGSAASVVDIEPWWAPGTTVQAIGHVTGPTMITDNQGKPFDCGIGLDPSNNYTSFYGCSCGPNLIYCQPSPVVGYANFPIFIANNPKAQRRLLWEEPARLIAHVAWNDRPLSDIILGDYSVGPVQLQHSYVRMGRRTGAVQLDSDTSWWKSPSGLVDPEHSSTDPWAWREFKISDRNPYLLADRNYKFDPRVEPRDSMKGVPAAGILTMTGMLYGYVRERVRAARMLETFACEEFIPPPAGETFNAYHTDPAKEGPCQVCHSRIDPAAIHFKRFSSVGADSDTGGALYMLGIGTWTFPDAWTTSAYPFDRDPFLHWVQWWKPGMRMTPISDADAQKNPEARFIDYLPPEQTLLGQTSDGTVGPLGFAKMIVAAGAFDRCAVRHLHERFGGRKLDPAMESGYLDTLVQQFVANGRKVRPFLKALTKTATFRRGL